MKRNRLPDTRYGVVHQVVINGQTLSFRVNDHADGSPGEIFIEMDKEGSTAGGLLNAIGTLLSILFQIDEFDMEPVVRKLSHMRFEPAGFVKDEDGDPVEIKSCSSIVDYIMHYIERRYNIGQAHAQTEGAPVNLPTLPSVDEAPKK